MIDSERRAPAFHRASALTLRMLALLFSGVVWASGAPPATTEESTPSVQPRPAETQEDDGRPTGESSQTPVPPELQSAYLVRVYPLRPAKLFKGLLEALTAEGYPPEEVEPKGRTVKTSFIDFKQGDFELQVAEPPPRLGGSYHVLQLIKMKIGKVSLEGVVAPGKDGSELRMRARILVSGLDRVKRVHVFVDRKSTGVIEADFIHKLEARLSLDPL